MAHNASSSSRRRELAADEEEGEEEEEELEEEELERFDDFTIASSWERFISEIEAVCRQWLADGAKNLIEKGAECLELYNNLYKVKRELKYSGKAYNMEYHFALQENGGDSCWDVDLHRMQLSFGVTNFVVLSPVSASGVVLDDPESTKLLSAIAIAFSCCDSAWPAFVPVHDPSRNAYIGIQTMGPIFNRKFEADRIASQVPIRLMHLEGLYELFLSKIILSSEDLTSSYLRVHFSMRLTYKTNPSDTDYDDTIESEQKEPKDETDDMDLTKVQWDDDCPWAGWFSAEDPIIGFELVAIWRDRIFDESLEMAELENASSIDADKWLLLPLVSTTMVDDSAGTFVGFASQLRRLVTAFDISFKAQFLEDFTTAESAGTDKSKSGATVPPLTVIDRILKELFHNEAEHKEVQEKYARTVKGAPLKSLFAQFCLHALWFGNCNIRAIAALWIEFVREVRWHWEESESLPRASNKRSIDLSTCLIHQKLQMLAICIEKKKSLQRHASDDSESEYGSPRAEEHSDNEKDSPRHLDGAAQGFEGSADDKSSNLRKMSAAHRGSAGVLQSMMLLNSFQQMHAPYTQDEPIMTEDMHEERLHAMEAFGDVLLSGQLERDILSSDMSAFKAANPDAVFEDFIRWHLPGDWETHKSESSECPTNSGWPPQGKLSERMLERGNLWRRIWNESPSVPANEQKPLLDPIREGEKILHYLETLRPQQLLEQMVCTAFKSSADILSEATYGDLKLMRTKMEQLYLTIISSLKSVSGKNYDETELIGDLKHLCTTFEHIEKLLIFAASIHRKLVTVPRLSTAMFADYFEYYLPKLGSGLTSICFAQDFCKRQVVSPNERKRVVNLFPPPTPNQSWRKVLSMGNLLNGHEPVLREIVFSLDGNMANDSYYGNVSSTLLAPAAPGPHEETVETHRMYIQGTSNDLWVALAATSWD